MTLGSVILWHNFPFQKDKVIKDRWFVYLGKYRYGDTNKNLYLFTTTTQMQYYLPGGEREKKIRISFKGGNYGFEKDCILDIDFGPEAIPEINLYDNSNITVKGLLPENILRQIHNLIERTKHISPKVKMDIHNSYIMAGIEGLKKPK